MDTSWWLAVIAVVVVALVVAVSDGLGRGTRRPAGRRRPPARPGERVRERVGRPKGRPSPGEIWWADVPYEDGPGSKDRPCLVLSVRGGTALVVKITSRYHDERPGMIALPPGAVGDARGRPSFLETDELRDIRVGEFRRRVGTVDPAVWDQVRHLAV
ncbi:type II toxin-antitoxin system PemK/MazF family toxin [Streptomyces sp. PKU-EA00015]|uniref:type II toxin-antitoxin system PemK/MazF family toxin n=1 Tax=Streptomyces sp. PKU-EA00015 TaxID=2748326 RepID=UPI0015A4BB2D|nr:type II toxin-antitoxin system PemK/MazF family toxin [Streptomyces sp. PKU-EA00015]NWF30098.1 type II toxin-antitoxin system PemK/MazF family toxin [Streptomyces sp. PKU-EA00015]